MDEFENIKIRFEIICGSFAKLLQFDGQLQEGLNILIKS
jgi:hypothetical protein